MRFIDGKGKIFGKVNAIDFLVIIVIIALVMGAVYKFSTINKSVGNASTTTQTVNYVVKVEKVRAFSFNNVKEGDLIFDKTSGNSIGKIVKVESEPAMDYVEKNNGSLVLGSMENRINLLISVEADGNVTNKGTFVGKTYELLVGAKKKFFTKYFECEGSVSQIL